MEEWSEIVLFCAGLTDAAQALGVVPDTLGCGCATYLKALDMCEPRVFIVSLFVYASKKSNSQEEILSVTRKLMDEIEYPHNFIVEVYNMGLDEQFFKLLGS